MEDFLKLLAQTTPHPFYLDVDYAEGSYIYDKSGKSYLDFISGVGVSHFGHVHPKIKDAIKEQLDKHMHVMVYGEFRQDTQIALAENLCSILPDSLNNVYLLNSGTEANEAALKLSKRYTGRSEMIAFKGAYHGSTHGSLSVSSNEYKKFAFRPLLPGVRFIELNKENQLDKITDKTACVILETIQGDAGIRIPELSYLQALREKCKEVGALLILDEIQCGIGRTGKNFAFEHYGIVPDILTLGKALGGGMPIGCVVSSKKIMSSLSNNPKLGHITTFGGHPVIAAAANASLNVLKEEIDFDELEKKGQYLEENLSHSRIKEIRRKGLFFAIEMESQEEVIDLVEACKLDGLLTFFFLSCPESFRIAPPINISWKDCEKAVNIIQKNLNK